MSRRKEMHLKREARRNAKKYPTGYNHEQRDLNLMSLVFFKFVRHPKVDENGQIIRPSAKEMIELLREFNEQIPLDL